MKFTWSSSFLIVMALVMLFENSVTGQDNEYQDEKSHSRQKRMLWVTNEGRLALPPGTKLTISLSLTGFLSPMTISLPFTIDFDELGLTDPSNPFGYLPMSFGSSMGKSMNSMFMDFLSYFTNKKRRFSRSVSLLPKQRDDRVQIYTELEDFLTQMGMDGKACLLRAICEIHKKDLNKQFGFMGEIVQLFFTATQSNHTDLMEDYIAAEKSGKKIKNCYQYSKKCPKSLFTNNNILNYDFTFDDDDETDNTYHNKDIDDSE